VLFNLTSNIIIGALSFNFVTDVEISSTWKQMTDNATIRLPKRLTISDNKKLENIIKVGDAVKIKLGWNWDLHEEFKGWVVRPVAPNIPFEIYCEDNMWLLKKGKLIKAWKQVYLDDLLEYLLSQLPSRVGAGGSVMDFKTLGKTDLGPFQINKATPAKVLDYLKERYGLISYFIGDTLYVGKVHTGQGSEVVYHFQENIIKSDLAFRNKDEVHIKITAESILPDNSKLSVTIEDDNSIDAEEHTLTFYNIKDKISLRNIAEHSMEQFHFDGYRGSFDAFGQPYCRHSDVAVISDNYYPERAGKYYIDRVTTRFGQNGFKRTIELGSKA
jgi:hypothetical protein